MDFSIGISGLDAARKGLEVVGNNMANAATEGYHRQRLDLTPAYAKQEGALTFGGGVEIAEVRRMIDTMLEKEILRQQSSLEQTSQEYATLRTIESAFGELASDTGLNFAIDSFFNALSELSAHPNEAIWQNQAVAAAEGMAGQFRAISDTLATLEQQIQVQAGHIVDDINAIATQIAQLNTNIQRIEISGATAANLEDQRDQLIKELAEIAPVETVDREFGMVDVSVGSIPVVNSTSTKQIELGADSDGKLGISLAGSDNYRTTLSGGKLGGLFALRNTIVDGIAGDLDSLAAAIINRVNEIHVQGVGSYGSFTELSGWAMADADVADWAGSVVDGSFFIRVKDTATGAIGRNEIAIDADSDSLSTIAAKISAVTGLNATVSNSTLRTAADAGYEFDFLPAVLASPTASDLNGSAPPAVAVSGIYSGAENQTFTFTLSGTGSVGNGALQLQVTDGDGETIKTFNIGSGYASGDMLDVGNGIKVSLSMGDVVDGDSFEVDAYGDTDTSGVLTALGMNAFFSGGGAADIAVSPEIAAEPSRMATAGGADLDDNVNALKLAAIRDESLGSLDSLSCGEFYRELVVDIGREVATRQAREENLTVLVQNLANQQSELSGVDINEEAAQMLVYEQMFQAMAKYMNTIQESIDTILTML